MVGQHLIFEMVSGVAGLERFGFGGLLAFCGEQNNSFEGGPNHDKIYKFIRASELPYHSRRDVHDRRAPLNWRKLEDIPLWLLKISLMTSKN
jgi:hypothetical protein